MENPNLDPASVPVPEKRKVSIDPNPTRLFWPAPKRKVSVDPNPTQIFNINPKEIPVEPETETPSAETKNQT